MENAQANDDEIPVEENEWGQDVIELKHAEIWVLERGEEYVQDYQLAITEDIGREALVHITQAEADALRELLDPENNPES